MKPRHKRLIAIAAGVVALGIAAALVLSAFKQNLVFFFTPSQVAANEALDNLTFVVYCNLQRLDGPVRGNGKIIQELESFFRGAGWNVIKVVWGREWDALLNADKDGALVNLMNVTPDGILATCVGTEDNDTIIGTHARM